MKLTEASQTTGPADKNVGRAEHDVVALGVAMAALILFVGTGGTVLPQIVRAWLGAGRGPDTLITNALLLNIALIIFGWRRYVELTKEVGERRKAEENARLLAETDALTGLLNRRSFVPASARLVTEVCETNQGAAVLMLDLDNFKQINDLHGHKAGDLVLTETARRIEAFTPPGGVAARLGGDEFALVVPYDRRTPDKLDQLAVALIEAAGKPVEIDSKSIHVSMSAGLARTIESPAPETAEDCAQSLLHHADIAMYHAKKRGRDGYAWFEPTMESELRFRNELETGIRAGIPKGEFVPFYEQQIDLASGELVGFEMLARWNSPKFGLVSPEIFIPIAEDIGVIAELSEFLIKQALEDAKQWNPKLSLSINISPIQLRDPWFSQKLLRLLVESGFPPHRLDIEITESCLHENVGVVRSVVTSLKNQGIQISLDDFGTGYSSLAQLRSLPFDRLKIDRSFVTELARDGANIKIVEAIVSLGRGFDLPITAEGIENAEVLRIMKAMGQLKGQGYLYGRPENAEMTLDRLAAADLLALEPELAPARPVRHTDKRAAG
ncbi:MAG: EAL domain-containing protein [Candidatus Andeanibacterium colombiense]|uniref:EAL domain-containing protein n=1 Tax=Candidatus Andeanibacterium colombiense TaxID=3121345 RepID=A0AAJ6BMU0_9SPHN|nr:MAG: EAL domain-containing protein [Sphingomonadaceae bacterium]